MTEERGCVVAAATDGACSGNPGPGGWGALLRFENGSVEEFGGFDPATTNNRMELQAALAVLVRIKSLPRHARLMIRTDSKYLINGMTNWLVNWKRKGWRTAGGKQVMNKDLWQALDLARLDDVSFEYVKGHSGDPDNERVDQIAVAFSKGATPVLKSEKVLISKTCDDNLSDINTATDFAWKAMNRLLSKLELADRLAKGGYEISACELASLVDQPLETIKERTTSWQWRNWSCQPLGNSMWKLNRIEIQSKES